MRTRPPIGARVKLKKHWTLTRASGKSGVVVAHHVDGIAIVVRLDPQRPLRPVRKPDRLIRSRDIGGLRRRFNDWVVDYHDVSAIRPETR